MSHRRREGFYLKFLLGGLVGFIVLIGLIWAGHDGYVRWQERRLVRRAVYALQHGDDRMASLAARSVLELKPSSAGAARVMAELAERGGDRVALQWRRKAAEAEPQSTEDALAWARCALQFNEIAVTEQAMATVNEAGRQTAGYHAVAAVLAQTQQQNDKAEKEWKEAVQLAPNEKPYQLQLGILQLRAQDSERHALGNASLAALRADETQRAPATRALINDGVARHQSASDLLQLAKELQEYPEATLSDRLIYLDFLHQLQSTQFSAYLSELEKNAAAKPNDLATLLSWMSQNSLNLLALDFIKTLSPEVIQQWPVPLAIADIYSRLKDWRALEESVKKMNWQQLDYLRHAYLARALRAQDKTAAAEREWTAAVKDASGRSDVVVSLVRVASEWKWENEATELLWTVAKYPEKQNEAFQTLYRLYAKTGDTQGLFRVLVRLAEFQPDNLNIQNNLAQVSMLLQANMDEARRTAANVYHKEPSNAAYATTFAYSLLTKGDTKGAVKIMKSLTEQQLRDPSISAYYGICLAAVHDEQATAFLQAGQKASLLPEEKALIDKAFANVIPSPKTD
jgi:tetratricopeptide (TPR) repeat protein